MNRRDKSLYEAFLTSCCMAFVGFVIFMVFACLVCLFCGCSSNKKIVSETLYDNSYQKNMNLEVSKVTHENGDIRRHIIIYDTSLPANLNTGSHPVKEEIEERISFEKIDEEKDSLQNGETTFQKYVCKDKEEKKVSGNAFWCKISWGVILLLFICIFICVYIIKNGRLV